MLRLRKSTHKNSISHTHAYTHTFCIYRTISVSHTYTLCHWVSHTHILTLCLSFTGSHAHTHTHTHTLSLKHMHILKLSHTTNTLAISFFLSQTLSFLSPLSLCCSRVLLSPYYSTWANSVKSKLDISRCGRISTAHLFILAAKLPSLKLNTLPRLSPASFHAVCSHMCMFTEGVSRG